MVFLLTGYPQEEPYGSRHHGAFGRCSIDRDTDRFERPSPGVHITNRETRGDEYIAGFVVADRHHFTEAKATNLDMANGRNRDGCERRRMMGLGMR